MTKSNDSNSPTEQPLTKADFKTVETKRRIPRRKITLVLITVLLNALIWSALICLVASLCQIISDQRDPTNIAQVVLNLTSVCVRSLVTKPSTD
jgi:hypothetical protein